MDKFKKHMVARALRELGQPYNLDDLLEEAWFPTKLSNPTKLQLHVWVDDHWHETCFVRIEQ